MTEKLQLLPQKRKPVLEGVAAFTAFAIAGAIPLFIYFADLLFPFNLSTTSAFLFAVGFSGLALFGWGATFHFT